MEHVDNALGCHQGAIIENTARTEHFVFLIDISGSMRDGGVAARFSQIHGDFLDSLAREHPGSLVSCIAFDEEPHVQYVAQPVETAPSLAMEARLGTEFPNAIRSGLTQVVTRRRIDTEHVTVIIVTDGDTESHNGDYYSYCRTRIVITSMRENGVGFLFLIASDKNPSWVEKQALSVGICRNEIMRWEHTADSLAETLQEVGEVLALGAAPSTTPSR